MAFNKRTWLARLGVGLNKFKLGETGETVELINNPDEVVQEGDALSASNLNDLENRIANGFGDLSLYIEKSQKGVVNGVATLGSDGKVPTSQIDYSQICSHSYSSYKSGQRHSFKFADGTLINTFVECSYASNVNYYYYTPFDSIPSVIYQYQRTSLNDYSGIYVYANELTYVNMRKAGSEMGSDTKVNIIAIGRWK